MREFGAYILAGGKSLRMGTDKGLISLCGKPMIQHVISTLNQVFADITIISNNEDYCQFGLKVISDLIPDHGPMGGIYTGLKNSAFPLNFFCSCDMPFVSKLALEQLLDQAEENQITVPIVSGKVQPLFAVYPRTIVPDMEQLIQQNQLKMVKMIDQMAHHKVILELSENALQRQFKNINAQTDLDEVEAKNY